MLKRAYEIKNKWTRSYLPRVFTGGVHSISKVEAMNSLIKRYLNSKCEISDITNFLTQYKRLHYNMNLRPMQKISTNTRETHPILKQLRNNFFDHVYDKHLQQFTLAHYFVIKPAQFIGENIILLALAPISNMVRLDKHFSLITSMCSCDSYFRYGLICRHMFATAN